VETATTVHVVAGRGPDDRPGIAPARPSLTPTPIQLDQPTSPGGAA
jgi:hypothetical protein